MNCPKCQKTMEVSNEPQMTANSHPPERGRHLHYARFQYHCEACDVWTTVEMPQPESEVKTATV